jgi:superfamily I DNA/RNA helicase
LSIYSFAVNSGKSLEQVLAENFPWCAEWEKELRCLFQSYTAAKQRQNVLDYDDLLLCWVEMMGDDNLAAEIGGRFDHILVDEYQDTNRLQSKILLRLKPAGRGSMVVGDDAQSIYSFRAATVRNILDFPKQFQPAAHVETLEQNYRSTEESHATDALYEVKVPKGAAEDWPAFAKLFDQIRQGKTTWPAEFELIQEWYAPHLDRIYDDAPLRTADVAH